MTKCCILQTSIIVVLPPMDYLSVSYKIYMLNDLHGSTGLSSIFIDIQHFKLLHLFLFYILLQIVYQYIINTLNTHTKHAERERRKR